jgi:hypothetical protein
VREPIVTNGPLQVLAQLIGAVLLTGLAALAILDLFTTVFR